MPYPISKESIMFAESRPIQICFVFMLDLVRMWKFFVYYKFWTKNFILYCVILYTNIHTKFQKNPSMCVESRTNTNVHHFNAQTSFQVLGVFSTKNFKKNIFCYRGPETCSKTKNKLQNVLEFFRFLGGSRIIQWPYFHSPLCHALYQPTYQISKESIHVCSIQSQYKCASFSCSTSLLVAILNFQF